MIELINVLKYYRVDNYRKVILNNVSMTFHAGHNYGLLGVNGAGKSTMLRLISGSEAPNAGRVRKSVRVSWPIGVSSSFHPLMTGRENVRFVARIYGADIRKTDRFVEDFSELGDYMDMPVGKYSSGMGARLAFGISMAIDFDVYLIDEVLAVGDAAFQRRSQAAFEERRKNASLFVVSHSMATIAEFCDKCGVLVDGQLLYYDDVGAAIRMYKLLNR